MGEDLGDVKVEHLDRFINATDHPPASKRFCAVAVVCSSPVKALVSAVLAGSNGSRRGAK